MDLEFEYDNSKAEKNLEKHGITFSQATELWNSLSFETLARSQNELRWRRVGKIKNKLYACFYTRRGEAFRLISVRRCRKTEEAFYYEKLSEENKNDLGCEA